MCGLVGVFWPNDKAPRDPAMASMLEIIAHRGPDGVENYRRPDGRYVVGFRRLAVIDLDTGDQPIADPVTNRILAGNGEIYNYLELRREETSYPYRTTGDMEVILPLASSIISTACLQWHYMMNHPINFYWPETVSELNRYTGLNSRAAASFLVPKLKRYLLPALLIGQSMKMPSPPILPTAMYQHLAPSSKMFTSFLPATS